jgi:5-oxopent-3-ene-1,2,5-tricarboxylate decarboxylase / 2-hydroxyhepta-2,4-diene-1,7-dioate isomerase
MNIAGHIYGVVLNDRAELEQLAASFGEAPYNAPPKAPVVYMKPRSTVASGLVRVRADEVLVAAPTLALLMARDASHCSVETALDCVGAVCLAVDFSLPQANYYRPAISFKNGDGCLALGDWEPVMFPSAISTQIDGKQVHSWQLDRLQRTPAELVADLSAFMTLRAGDVLLIGLPGDAPQVSAGQTMSVSAQSLQTLDIGLAA